MVRPQPALAAAALALLLAACSAKESANSTSAATAAGGTTPSATGPGDAQMSGGGQVLSLTDLPHLRAGQWQEVIDDGDGKPETSTVCRSGNAPVMKTPTSCATFTVKRTLLGAYVVDMNCATPKYTLIYHGEASGDFQTHMTSDVQMSMNILGHPNTTKAHVDWRYLGPCPAGAPAEDE